MDMPDMDDRIGACGAYPYSYAPCTDPGVARVIVETYDYDHDYRQASGAILGSEVMVVVCQRHKNDVIEQVKAQRKAEAEREAAREVAQAEIDRAEAALRAAHDEYNRI